MPFNRWLIEGTLTTIAPLHIGNGEVTTRKDLSNVASGERIEIDAIATDVYGKAYLTGSTLKGKLRAAAKNLGLNSTERLFGSEDVDHPNAVGGKLELCDAPAIVPALDFAESIVQTPYWCAERLTGVAAGITLNRQRRTASDERLFHFEFVPKGVTFKIKISGPNLDNGEVDDLLRALESFNAANGRLTLGASDSDGWGRLNWDLTKLKRMQQEEIRRWLESDAPTVGELILPDIPDHEFQDFKLRARNGETNLKLGAQLKLTIKLKMDGNFLVNDPSQTTRSDDDELPNHAPLLNGNGQVVLPASSIRGAVRNQAEKILRTIGGVNAACYPDNDGPRPACKAVQHLSELAALCPACQIFGASGWRSPLEFSDFDPSTSHERIEGVKAHQEFVAIDRFTGGGSKGAKFNAASVYKPVLKGHATLNLTALERTGAGKWALALLILTLRDLAEGDIRLGFGAAKGYGAVQAEVEAWWVPLWEEIPSVFRDGELKEAIEEGNWPVSLHDDAKIALMLWVEELRSVAVAATETRAA
jgi:CRISPR/Cas system CSM-associated protein Csm3 (group 7 of RAMP superfamily)